MTTAPIVSILMPCFNARERLPWALGSVLAQTFSDWELVLVDDGSSDRPEDIVELADDRRTRVIRLQHNTGRGHARQVALDNVRGEFVAMLDADDWMYPDRLEVELDALRRHDGVAIVSAAMSLTDARNEITGVRLAGDGRVHGPFRGLDLPIAHAPSMIRREALAGVRFDHRMRRAEDTDFLLRALQGKRYLAVPRALYAYREVELISGRKAVEAHAATRGAYRKHLRRMPVRVGAALARSLAKEMAYRGASRLALEHLVTNGKQERPSRDDVASFRAARESVQQVVAAVFGAEAIS